MLGWFQRLMPREDKFFELFERHATVVVAGADALRKLLDTNGQSGKKYCEEIFARENEADEITRQVLIAVRRTFITPFDRADIQTLISTMDDTIDQMNRTAKTITLFEVKSFEPEMQRMGEIIWQAANLTRQAVPLLSSIGTNAGRLHDLTAEVIRIEEQADQLNDEGRRNLYRRTRDGGNGGASGGAMDFIIGAELYSSLEKVVDRFEDVSNEISSIVTDHL
jgi:predicted phosphate transport protein (TIGR00153 family)